MKLKIAFPVNNFIFLETPGAKAAFRTAFAITVTGAIALQYDFKAPYWACISALVIMSPYLGPVKSTGLYRIIGTIIGVIIGYALSFTISGNNIAFILMCFFLVSIGCYLSAATPYRYTSLLGTISCFLVLGEISINHLPGEQVIFWRVIEIILGVVIAWAISSLIVPVRASLRMQKHLSGYFQEMRIYIRNLMQNRENAQAFEKLTEIFAILKCLQEPLKSEINTSFLDIVNLEKLFERLEILQATLQLLDTKINPIDKYLLTENNLSIQAFLQAVINFLNYLSLVVSQQVFDTAMVSDLKTKLNYLEQAFKSARKKGEFKHLSDHEMGILHSYINQLQIASKLLIEIEALLMSTSKLSIKKALPLWQRFMALKFDKEIIQFSLKGGVAVALALTGWLFTGWPGGLQGIVSSIVISMQRNIYDTQNIAWLRFIGCILGGAAGFIIIKIIQPQLWLILISLFFASWLFAYITFNKPRIGYAGTQANIALIFILVEPLSQAFTIKPGLERLAGVILGIFATGLVMRFLWPINPLKQLNNVIKENYNLLQEIISVVYDLEIVKSQTLDKYAAKLKLQLNKAEGYLDTLEKTHFIATKKLQQNKIHLVLQRNIAALIINLMIQGQVENSKLLCKTFHIDLSEGIKRLKIAFEMLKEEYLKNQSPCVSVGKIQEIVDQNIKKLRSNLLRTRVKHNQFVALMGYVYNLANIANSFMREIKGYN